MGFNSGLKGLIYPDLLLQKCKIFTQQNCEPLKQSPHKPHFIKLGVLLKYVKKNPPLDSIISYKTHSTLFMEHSLLYKATNPQAIQENSCIL